MVRHILRTTALFLVCGLSQSALATKVDTRPRPAIMLHLSDGVIVQSSTNDVALYDLKGSKLRSFSLRERIEEIDISIDENYLLLAGDEGKISVWDVQTGKKVTSVRLKGKRGGYIYDASFSPDGTHFIATASRSVVGLYRTSDGKLIDRTEIGSPMSVATSANGQTLYIINLVNEIFRKDVPTDTITQLSTSGAWPIRLTKDGLHVLFRSDNRGYDSLRVLAVGTDDQAHELAPAGSLHRIRPLSDGGALITMHQSKNGGEEVGLRFDPETMTLSEVFRLPQKLGRRAMAFDPDRGLGVTTDWRLSSRIIVLKTGRTLVTIGGDEDHEPSVISTSGRSQDGGTPSIWIIILVVCGCGVAGGCLFLLKRRASKPPEV
jgi:hypothetical protein